MSEATAASVDETASVEDCLDYQAIDHFITCKLKVERRFVVCRLASIGRDRVAAVVLAPVDKESLTQFYCI